MHTSTFTYINTMTWQDFFALRTGYLPFTLMAAFLYALGLSLLLPGNVRLWLGILREVVLTFHDETIRLGHGVSGLATRTVIRAQLLAVSGRPRGASRPALVPDASIWASGDPVPHPARVACANPASCEDCRPYL